MRAFIIDPIARTIVEHDYNGEWETIAPAMRCDVFTCVEFGDARDCVFVDDEGLLKRPERFFIIKDYPQPLAGRAMVLGTDEEGDSVAPQVDLAWLQANVRFVGVREALAYAEVYEREVAAMLAKE